MSEVIESLTRIQYVIGNPRKAGVGQVGSRKYNYATLDDVLECVLPCIRAEKMFLTQGIDGDRLVTKIYKGDEELVLDSRRVDLSGNSQQQGSAETYAKRYALCSIFCLVGQDDDDGAAASQPKDDRLKAAKGRLWDAIKRYAKERGLEPEDVLEGVQKRPEYAETVEFFDAVTYELETAN